MFSQAEPSDEFVILEQSPDTPQVKPDWEQDHRFHIQTVKIELACAQKFMRWRPSAKSIVGPESSAQAAA